MSGPDVKSESVDLMKLLQQVSGQLSQITQGATSGQMTGQRVDRVDTQDIGADEMKSLAGGFSSMAEPSDEREFAGGLRTIWLQILSNMARGSNADNYKGAENLLGVNTLDALEAQMIQMLAAKGYDVTKKE